MNCPSKSVPPPRFLFVHSQSGGGGGGELAVVPVTWGTYGTDSLSTLYPGPDRQSAMSAVWKYSGLSSLSRDSGSLGTKRTTNQDQQGDRPSAEVPPTHTADHLIGRRF